MMDLYSSALLTVAIALSSHAQWVHVDTAPGTQENDECHRQGDQVWYCKQDTECPSAKLVLRNGGSLKSCSWKNANTHIICCPPDPPDSAYTKSISEIKCNAYQNTLCNVNIQTRSLDLKPTPEDVPEYKDNDTSNADKTLNVLEVYGGLDAAPLAHPHMVPTHKGIEGYTMVHTSVFGGVPAPPLVHSHMAGIGFGSEEDISWQCGGSLISERFVISAAHCSDTFSGPARWARLGELDTASVTDIAKPQHFRIVERLVHPDYQPPTLYSDIVLFRLDRDATFNEYVRPACLHLDTTDSLADSVLAIGWGQIETGGPKSTKLLEASLNIIPVERCKQSLSSDPRSLPRGIDTKTMMCAGAPGKNTCRGDSGGPLVLVNRTSCLATQVGITSFGGPCDEDLQPGVYVRVAYFLPWVESVVWPEEKRQT